MATSRAATLDWDPNITTGVTLGGAGSWDNLNLGNWWDGAINLQWNNANNDTARFGGTPGTGAVVIDPARLVAIDGGIDHGLAIDDEQESVVVVDVLTLIALVRLLGQRLGPFRPTRAHLRQHREGVDGQHVGMLGAAQEDTANAGAATM